MPKVKNAFKFSSSAHQPGKLRGWFSRGFACAGIGFVSLFAMTTMTHVSAQTTNSELAPVAETYRQVDGRDLKLYLFDAANGNSRNKRPAVVLLHGGGWTVGEPSWSFMPARRLAQLGMLAISVEYRLSDAAHTPLDAFSDTCQALHWVRQNAQRFGIDPKRIAGFGESAGGQLLALAATVGCGNKEGIYANGGPDALAFWSPALDVAENSWFIQQMKDPQVAKANSPLFNLKKRIPATFIVGGEADIITPAAGLRAFCDKAVSLGSRCELKIYPGVGHLLTRKLEDQVSGYDPDPELVKAGMGELDAFFGRLWLGRGG